MKNQNNSDINREVFNKVFNQTCEMIISWKNDQLPLEEVVFASLIAVMGLAKQLAPTKEDLIRLIGACMIEAGGLENEK